MGKIFKMGRMRRRRKEKEEKKKKLVKNIQMKRILEKREEEE